MSIMTAVPTHAGFEPEMVVISEGDFLMGCDKGAANERPVHRVWISSFALARFTVTNRLYRIFVEKDLYQAPSCWDDERFNHPDQPVISVSWFDVARYCAWLAASTGKA